MTKDFRSNGCLSFFITAIALSILESALSIWCLRVTFSSRNKPRCFWKEALSTWILLRLMTGWLDTFFFLANKTSWAGLCGSRFKSIFQLNTHFEIKERLLQRAWTISFLSLTIVNREVSSFLIRSVNHCYRWEKKWAQNWVLKETCQNRSPWWCFPI